MHLLNREATRRFILEKCKTDRYWTFTRISESALNEYEARLMAWIEADIASHPSVGKTFNPFPKSNGGDVKSVNRKR